MPDIMRIQCKKYKKTSLCCQNSVPYKEIGMKQSNGDGRTSTVSSYVGVPAHAQWKYG